MRKFVSVVLMVCSLSVHANDQEKKVNITELITSPIRPVTDAIVNDMTEYILKGTSYERHQQEAALRRDKKTLRATRSVKDCIKPGGLIDDDVQMCVNGTREKTW